MIRWLERINEGKPPVIFGDGAQTMDFVFVGDVARANLLAAVSSANDEAFNVGTGVETSLKELCFLLCDAAGRPDLEPVFAEARKVNGVTRRRASVERAREALGFEAATGLAEGLRHLVAWYPEAALRPAAAAAAAS
jgi:UDP-glucose 4-epimerase